MGYPLNDTNYNWERRRRGISGDSLINTANSMTDEQKQDFREAIGADEGGSKKIIIPTDDNTFEVASGSYIWQDSSGNRDFIGDIRQFFLSLDGMSGEYVLRIMEVDDIVNEYAVFADTNGGQTNISVYKNTTPSTEMIVVTIKSGELNTVGSMFPTYGAAISGYLELQQRGGWVSEYYEVEYYDEQDTEIYSAYDPIMHAAAILYLANPDTNVFSFPVMIDEKTYVFFRDNENTTSTEAVYKEPITNKVLTFSNGNWRGITIS